MVRNFLNRMKIMKIYYKNRNPSPGEIAFPSRLCIMDILVVDSGQNIGNGRVG